MHLVLNELVDAQSLFELQPDFGRNMITALARIGGIPCMLMANQPACRLAPSPGRRRKKASSLYRRGQRLRTAVDQPAGQPLG